MQVLQIDRRNQEIRHYWGPSEASQKMMDGKSVANEILNGIRRRLSDALETNDWPGLLQAARGLQNTCLDTLADAIGQDVSIDVEDSIAGLPWELTPVDGFVLAEVARVGRTVRISRSGAYGGKHKGRGQQPLNLPLRVLIAFDPTPPLESTRTEAERLRKRIESDDRLELAGWLVNPDRETFLNALKGIDILHFTGHGRSYPAAGESGWVFRNEVFSPAWIHATGLDRWPAIVFANACPTQRLADRPLDNFEADLFAMTLLNSGVRHYINTIAQIPAGSHCADLAYSFYDGFLRGLSVGEALRRAKLGIAFPEFLLTGESPLPPPTAKRDGRGTTIASCFVLYGRPDEVPLLPPRPPQIAAETQQPSAFGQYRLLEIINSNPVRTIYRAAQNDEIFQLASWGPFQSVVTENAIEDAYLSVRERIRAAGLAPIREVLRWQSKVGIIYDPPHAPPLDVRTPRSLENIEDLVVRIGAALEAAHREKIFHGCLTPSRVHINENVVAFSDLGLLEVITRLRLPWDVENQPYRPPEHGSTALPRLDASGDTWALAVITFELFAGRHPFEDGYRQHGNWDDAVRLTHAVSVRQIRPELPDSVEKFLINALAKQPKDRFSTMSSYLNEFRRACRGTETVGGFDPDLERALASSETLFFIKTDDEHETSERLSRIARRMGYRYKIWSLTSGLQEDPTLDSPGPFRLDPLGVITWLSQEEDSPTFLVLRDYDAFLDDWQLSSGSHGNDVAFREVPRAMAAIDPRDPGSWVTGQDDASDQLTASRAILKTQYRRIFEDLVNVWRGRRKMSKVVFTSRQFIIPDDFIKYVQCFVALPAPRVEVEALLAKEGVGQSSWATQYVSHAAGLTLTNISRALSLARSRHGELNEKALDDLQRMKQQEIRRRDLLEWSASDITFHKDVIGLEGLRLWVEALKMHAIDPLLSSVIKPPRGVVLGGAPGTGKSHCAQAIAGELGWPLLRLDLGRIFTSILGEAEQNMRDALGQVELMSPLVLWIDDLDKALAGSVYSSVSQRVLQTFLSWLQERNDAGLLVATMSDPLGLPPEILRSGRFDAIFFLDCPNREERGAMFQYFLRRMDRDASSIEVDRLAALSEWMTGADIEGCVREALFAAAAEGRADPTTEEITWELQNRLKIANTVAAIQDDTLRAAWLSIALPASRSTLDYLQRQPGGPIHA